MHLMSGFHMVYMNDLPQKLGVSQYLQLRLTTGPSFSLTSLVISFLIFPLISFPLLCFFICTMLYSVFPLFPPFSLCVPPSLPNCFDSLPSVAAGSTRRLYERKLASLMADGRPDGPAVSPRSPVAASDGGAAVRRRLAGDSGERNRPA